MKLRLTVSLFLFFSSFWAHADDSDYDERMHVDNSSQLNTWCKNESAEYFLAHGLTPNNWVSSRWVDGEYLFVEGAWKVEGDKHKVECKVRKGIAEKYAKWKLDEK